MAVEVIRRFVDVTGPAVPTGLAVGAVTGSSIPLMWNANTEEDFLAYILERSTDNLNWGFLATTPLTNYTDTVSGLNYYRLRAQDRSGIRSNPSNSVGAGIPQNIVGSVGTSRFTGIAPTSNLFTARLEAKSLIGVGVNQQGYVGISLRNNGILYTKEGTFSTPYVADSNEWKISNTDSVSLYETRLSKTSGSDPNTGPTLGAWNVLSSDRTWEWIGGELGVSFNGTLAIRHASTGVIVTSKSVGLSASQINI